MRPRSGTRRHAGSWLILVFAVASCQEAPGPALDLGGNPINGVTVYAGSHHQFAEVGDTTHVMAWGYHDGEGIGTQFVATAAWSPNDTTMLRVVRSRVHANGASATLVGVKPGLAVLSARLNGVTGSDTIRVLPRIQQLQLLATRTTLAMGDTVTVWPRADDQRGDSIAHLRPLIVVTWESPVIPLRYIGPWPVQRFVGSDTGTVRFSTTVANDSAVLRIRVVRAP